MFKCNVDTFSETFVLEYSSSSLVCIAQTESVFVEALKGVYLVAINEARGLSPPRTDVRAFGYSTLYTVSSKFWSPSKLPTTIPLALCNANLLRCT